MIVSIETPVFKGKWLNRCIDSVLTQSSSNWTFSLVWDGGDEESHAVLKELEQRNHPNISVYFEENRGIANARHFLSERSRGDYILPLDDDDVLTADAVEKLLAFAESKPWSSLVRGRRKFIDEEGRVVDQAPWFPFEARHYQHGMVTDVFNHSQPYLINRSLYQRTAGWAGFADFMFAGEDCDIILKLEEFGPIELIDEVLYYYRLNPNRASDTLEVQGAHEMWRRLADMSIARMGLPIVRTNEVPPYTYERMPQLRPDISMIDFVIPLTTTVETSHETHPLRQALLDMGVSEDAVHFAVAHENSTAASVNQCFQNTSRAMVCVLDEGVRFSDTGIFDTLLNTLHEQKADIIGPKILADDGSIQFADPKFDNDQLPVSTACDEQHAQTSDCTSNANWLPSQCLLIRREVINAVDGYDEAYECNHLWSADFCLKARLRDFVCIYTGTTHATCPPFERTQERSRDLERYHEKWRVYAHLFQDQKLPE